MRLENRYLDFDELNKFFTSIGPELSRQSRKPQHNINLSCFGNTMFLKETSLEKIALIIKKMKTKKC